MDCLPQNVNPLDGKWQELDNTDSFPKGTATSAGYNKNDCFQLVSDLLSPQEDKKLLSVDVKTGYFEDKAIAQILKTLIDSGVHVSIVADQSKLAEHKTTEKKKQTINFIKELLGDHATFHDNFTSGGIYHPKFMEVSFEKKEADGKTYIYTYIVIGSYNFTVAAWRSNQESMTILVKKKEKKKEEPLKSAKSLKVAEGDAAKDDEEDIKKLTEEMQKLDISSSSSGEKEKTGALSSSAKETKRDGHIDGDFSYGARSVASAAALMATVYGATVGADALMASYGVRGVGTDALISLLLKNSFEFSKQSILP